MIFFEEYVTHDVNGTDMLREPQGNKDEVVEQEARYEDLPQPLGDVRQQTRYSLRSKPTKDKKYYQTSIDINTFSVDKSM